MLSSYLTLTLFFKGKEVNMKKGDNDITVESIEMPVYFWEDEDTGEKHYDFEEMANELENRICDILGRNVLIMLSEIEDDGTVWKE